MSNDYLDPIVHCYVDGAHSFKKYHTVKNVESRLLKFETFALQKHPGADYVNYYWRHLPKGRNYAFRRYLTPKDAVTLKRDR